MHTEPRPDPAEGVFETLLARDGGVQALELHLGRLASAVGDLYGERLSPDLGRKVRAVAADLTGPHRVRLDAIPGPDAMTITISTTPVDTSSVALPVTLKPALVPGGIGPYKWRDRRLLEQLTDGQTVPLIVDNPDELLEASWANVWILEGGGIVTPAADGRLLPGVTRELLLKNAVTIGLEAAAEPISLARATAADAIFLTSSVRLAVGAALATTGQPGPDEHAGPAEEDPTVEAIRTALSAAATR